MKKGKAKKLYTIEDKVREEDKNKSSRSKLQKEKSEREHLAGEIDVVGVGVRQMVAGERIRGAQHGQVKRSQVGIEQPMQLRLQPAGASIAGYGDHHGKQVSKQQQTDPDDRILIFTLNNNYEKNGRIDRGGFYPVQCRWFD